MPPAMADAEMKSDAVDVVATSPITFDRTAIFLDWDDTLLCSSYLSREGFRLDTDMDNEHGRALLHELKDLESCVVNVISMALSYGDLHIVTNAETGWVQLSAQKFLPAVVPYLSKITVVSARSTYEPTFGNSPLKWKFHAFQEALRPLLAMDDKRQNNILSFGDSHVEREAVRAITLGQPFTHTKSIKFAERPSVEQLQRQLELICNCFQFLYSHAGDLDLCMSLSAPPATESGAPAADTVTWPQDESQPCKHAADDAAAAEKQCWDTENLENTHPNTSGQVVSA